MAVVLSLDGMEFSLQKHQDFSWIHQIGTVFCVFDKQDSGNLCFGVSRGEERYFVKYAGAVTGRCPDEPCRAVERLKASGQVYRDLRRAPGLIRLQDCFQTEYGYAQVFDWVEGECMHAHWTFDQFEKYTDPRSSFYRFTHLPLEEKLSAMQTVVGFLCFAEKAGYTAVDFYDGSLLYDFDRKRMHICDVDLFQKGPIINRMGKFWGSSRLQSPEEQTMGAVVDSVSNVFMLGARMFDLLGGGGRGRCLEQWPAGESRYRVALRAVEPKREARYPSISAFADAWDHAGAL